MMVRTKLVDGKGKYALFDGEITSKSWITAMRENKDVGDFYRDLFIHRLEGGIAERYLTILMDGYMLGIVGLHLAALTYGAGAKKNVKASDYPAMVTFAFSVPHERYKRLHKLTLMSLLSSWLWDDAFGGRSWYDVRGCPKKVQSTMLTPYPENKTARGTGLKMLTRDKQGDGTFKLVYQGDVVKRTREETLTLWLKKYGNLQK